MRLRVRVPQPAANHAAPDRPTSSPLDSILEERGEELEPDVRAEFEARFGHDLGRIRVHAGGAADAAARQLDARALAVGPHLVFASGEYRPATLDGRRLLAHEIAHAIQGSNALQLGTTVDPGELRGGRTARVRLLAAGRVGELERNAVLDRAETAAEAPEIGERWRGRRARRPSRSGDHHHGSGRTVADAQRSPSWTADPPISGVGSDRRRCRAARRSAGRAHRHRHRPSPRGRSSGWLRPNETADGPPGRGDASCRDHPGRRAPDPRPAGAGGRGPHGCRGRPRARAGGGTGDGGRRDRDSDRHGSGGAAGARGGIASRGRAGRRG